MNDTDTEGGARARSVSGSGGRRHLLRGFVVVLLILVVVFLVFGVFLVRTRGFRSFLADDLTKRTGTRMTIGTVRIGWPYALVISDLKSEGFGEARNGGFFVRELRFTISGNLRWRMEITGCNLFLVRSDLGIWKPVFLAYIGDLQNVEEMDGLVKSRLNNIDLEIKDSSVTWIGPSGKEIAATTGLHFSVMLLRLRARELRYYYLGADSVRVGESRFYNVRREWFATNEKSYIELEHTADEKTAPSAGHTLWSSPDGAAQDSVNK